MDKCPTCGQTLPHDYLLIGSDFFLRGKQRQIFDAVVKAGKYGIASERLWDILYGDDPNGGPEHTNTLAVHVSIVNRKISRIGKKIEAPRGQGEHFYVLRDL